MKGPWRALLVQGSAQIFHFLWPDPNENNYSSETKDGTDPQPGSEFKFFHCLNVFKKHYHLRPRKDPAGPFLSKSPVKLSSFYRTTKMKKYIPVEPNVGLNSNNILNLSLSMV